MSDKHHLLEEISEFTTAPYLEVYHQWNLFWYIKTDAVNLPIQKYKVVMLTIDALFNKAIDPNDELWKLITMLSGQCSVEDTEKFVEESAIMLWFEVKEACLLPITN